MDTAQFLERLSACLEWLHSWLASLFGEPRRTERNANFASKTKLLSPLNKGWCLDGVACTSLEVATRGALIFGKSGGGKTSAILLPSALKMMGTSSLIIHDPSVELAGLVSGIAHQRNIRVDYLNYLRPELGGYNPLHRVRRPSEMRKLASLIMYSALGRSASDNFWNANAALLLSLLIEVVCNQEEAVRNMYNVAYLCDVFGYNAKAVDKLVLRCNNARLLSEYKSLISYESKVLSSVTSTVKAAVEIFKDEDIARVTSYDSIDIESYRSTPSILFINSSLGDLKYHALISSIFFTQVFNAVMSAIPPKSALGIFFLLDEASSLSLHGILPTAFANIRKYFAGILTSYQSYHQMISLFGDSEARAIRECCYCTEYLPGQNLQTASEISSTLGDYEFINPEGVKKTRPLLLPNEVRENDAAILFAGNMPGMQLRLKPYFHNPQLRKLTEVPPYYPPARSLPDLPPLLPLE